jgi:alpha-methylacyl-CoA racemase
MSALRGIRVLDLSRLLPGPFATMVLADLGAEVDKLEDTGGGDYLRFMPPLVRGQAGGEAAEVSPSFMALNRGKRSLSLDLKRPEGKAAFLRLVGRYDVLVESFRPGVLEKLGLGQAALRAAHPRLIVCALSGYGATGPLRDRAGHDVNFLARSGVLGLTGPAGAPPQISGAQVADIGGGALFAVAGILAALLERGRTGEGAFIDTSLAEGSLSLGLYGLMNAFAGVGVARGEDPLTGGIAAYGTYATKDGAFVALAALEPKFWIRFAEANGLAPNMEALAPGPHQLALKAEIAALIASRTGAEWAAFADQNDCCLEVVLSPEAVRTDAHFVERGLIVPTEGSAIPQVLTPLSERGKPARRAPAQGEHTRAVLGEAGFLDGEIDALLASGVAR